MTVTDPGVGPATCSFSVTDPIRGIVRVVLGAGFAGMVSESMARLAILEDSVKVPSELAVQVELIAPDETATGDPEMAVRPATLAVVVLPLTLAAMVLAVRMPATPTEATGAGFGFELVASGVGATTTAPVAWMPIPSGLVVLGAARATGTVTSSAPAVSAPTVIMRRV